MFCRKMGGCSVEKMITSVDVASFIKYWSMAKYYHTLNKTQVNKLLFIAYGFYLVLHNGERPFSDDTPKAWPFGPVFPRVYRLYSYNDNSIQKSVLEMIREDRSLFNILTTVVARFHTWSASRLTEWSHRPGSPWHKTVYGENGTDKGKWGEEISDELIISFFGQSIKK